jgi:tRNA U34 2-thiouridine synthase MnmA/TrmU
MTKSAKKVFVGLPEVWTALLSAALLKEQGYDVTVSLMKNWSNEKKT